MPPLGSSSPRDLGNDCSDRVAEHRYLYRTQQTLRRRHRLSCGCKSTTAKPRRIPHERFTSDKSGNVGDCAMQRVVDSTTSYTLTKRSSHCSDDTSRDDHVLERHDAVLVRAQTVQEVAGLNVILQHEIPFTR